jgi:hypothetical protein
MAAGLLSFGQYQASSATLFVTLSPNTNNPPQKLTKTKIRENTNSGPPQPAFQLPVSGYENAALVWVNLLPREWDQIGMAGPD